MAYPAPARRHARVSSTSPSSSAVDLSRLPAPDVVEQLSFESVLADIIAYLQDPEVFPEFDATVESDPAVKLLQVFAYRELLIRAAFNDRARQVMVAYATKGNLDHLGALVGVPRLLIDPGDPDQGIDPVYETDVAFRERIVLAPDSFSVAGPNLAYIFHARSADGTIRDASATSPAPSEVLVSVLSATGDGTATEAQLDAVRDRLGIVFGNKVRPLTDLVTVASASIVAYVVEAQLTLFRGPDPTVVLANALASLDAMIASTGKLGMDVTRAGIIAALFVEGVQNVALISPVADVVVDDTQATHCAGTNVTVAGLGA